jgi:predicted nucleic acid-binding protein
MTYLDASYLVKLYADEPGAGAVIEWAEGKGDFACAMHGRLELISALKRYQREGSLTSQRLKAIIQLVENDEASGLIRWLPLTPELIATTCQQVLDLPSSVFLRAADALHLACAADAGLKQIYSHDRHLLAAASHFGLKGVDVIKAG